jgi:hypothetical protein
VADPPGFLAEGEIPDRRFSPRSFAVFAKKAAGKIWRYSRADGGWAVFVNHALIKVQMEED